MANRFVTLLKSTLRRNSSMIRSRGNVINAFSKKIGLVSFGRVDQHSDDHEVIRGLTVSTTHDDTHYSVGAYDGYDISIADRFDVVVDETGKETTHNWLIMQVDLQKNEAIPHIFLKPIDHSHTSYQKFFTAFNNRQPINEMLLQAHSPEFHARYKLIAASTFSIEIEQLFTPDITNTIAARFWPHAIEILDGKLYVYTTESRLTSTLLDTALESALWLARVLDQDSED